MENDKLRETIGIKPKNTLEFTKNKMLASNKSGKCIRQKIVQGLGI